MKYTDFSLKGGVLFGEGCGVTIIVTPYATLVLENLQTLATP
jgi:hypothetical protein